MVTWCGIVNIRMKNTTKNFDQNTLQGDNEHNGKRIEKWISSLFDFSIKITPRIGKEMLKNMPNNARITTISLEQY
jgi:hypothetical protein